MKVDLGFNSFDEVKDHPMLESFLASFEQLLEGAGHSVDDLLSGENLLENTENNSKGVALIADAFHTCFDICKAMPEDDAGKIEVKASIPKVASAHVCICSKGLGKAITLGARTMYEGEFRERHEY